MSDAIGWDNTRLSPNRDEDIPDLVLELIRAIHLDMKRHPELYPREAR